MPKRKAIPASVQEAVLREAGYMCGNPRCRHVLTLELHHIQWVRDGGGNEPLNLLALCPNCHSLHTAGHIPESAIRHWKGMLEALNHAFGRKSVDLLLFLHDPQSRQVIVSGDGALQYAGLIAAGLVKLYGSVQATARVVGPHAGSSSHRLRLTDKGERLVGAWIQGDQEEYERSLAIPEDG